MLSGCCLFACERFMLSIVGVVDFLSSGKLGLALQQILWRLRRLDVRSRSCEGVQSSAAGWASVYSLPETTTPLLTLYLKSLKQSNLVLPEPHTNIDRVQPVSFLGVVFRRLYRFVAFHGMKQQITTCIPSIRVAFIFAPGFPARCALW
jgi:hypothetical protein